MNIPRFRAYILLLPLFATLAATAPAHGACNPSITVTSNMDSGAGSLRQALADVCAEGTITFAGDYTITLASQLEINKNMTINGAGQSVTVSGNRAVGVFYVNPGVTFNLQNLTVSDGYDYDGSGIANSGTMNVVHCTISGNRAVYNAGGIINTGSMTISNSTISQNFANLYGGGLVNFGTLSIANCTISGNSAASGGGGIENHATLAISNSTISGNSSTNIGGGIYNNEGSSTIVTNSTISGNSAANGGGIYTYNGSTTVTNCTVAANSGIGIYNDGSQLNVTNSIIAKGTSGKYCCYGGHSSASNNLADDNTCGSDFTESSSILLGALGNYGGGAQTLPLLPGSAAIDAGETATCSNAAVNNLDQRGLPRPAGHCDIGAFESQGFTLAKSGGDNQTAVINTDFVSALQVTLNETGGAPLSGALINFSAPPSGASTNPATFASATGAGGVASAPATANGTVGAYSVTASAAGAAGVDFILENVAGLATLTIGFAGDGSGTITSTNPDDPDISCIKASSGGCNASYPLKTSVTLAASGDWKSLFGNWSGGIAGSDNPVTFNMNSDKTVTATFNPDYKVRRLSGGALFSSIQDAYASVPAGSITIQAQVKSFLEELLFNNGSYVTLSGGMDAGYNPTTGYSTVKKLTVGAGQAVISNFIVK